MTDPLRIHVFTLTDTQASEHIYAASLLESLLECDIVEVDDWQEADVIHLFEVNFYTGAALKEFQYPTMFRMLRSNTPVVVSTDDLFFINKPELTAKPWLYPLNHYTQRWLLGQVDAVVAISESVQSALSGYIGESNIHTVQHGVDERYRNDGFSDSPPFVLHVSLASKRKNPKAIVETARRLNERFVIAGSGWQEHFQDFDDISNIDVLGYVTEDKLIDLYHRAAVFYFPTLHEGFGLPILEAMAASTAVVTSDVYSVPEVTGDAAVLHDPCDIDAHLKSIERLLAGENERRDLAKRAHERAHQFTWERAARETERVYREVLSGGDNDS